MSAVRGAQQRIFLLLVSLFIFVLSHPRVVLLKGLRGGSIDSAKDLHDACYAGDAKAVQKLLESDTAPDNYFGEDGSSALLLASENGNTDIVYMLLDNGAQVDLQRKDGASALMGASAQGHLQTVALLLANGASPDLQDMNGNTALMFASDVGHVQVAALLLDKGANPDVQNVNGTTALMWASYRAHTDIVHLLIDQGATPHLQDKDGVTALHITEADAAGGWSRSAEQQEEAAVLIEFYRKGSEQLSDREQYSSES